MRSVRWIIAILLLTGTVRAADVDMSSPKAAVKSLYTAVGRVDTAAVRQLLYVENDPQQELAGGYGKVILASKRLGDIAKQKFPTSQNQLAQGTIVPEDIAKVESAMVSITGDNAVVRITGNPDPIKLRRVDGSWKILVGEGAETDNSGSHRADRLTLLQNLADAMNQSADELNADKYPTIADAEAAIKQRMSAVVSKALQADLPASRPATQPK
jgi:hypothetical protein